MRHVETAVDVTRLQPLRTGSILTGAARDFCRNWSNQKEITVKGSHFIQEDSPHEIGRAVADFARSVRDGTFAGD